MPAQFPNIKFQTVCAKCGKPVPPNNSYCDDCRNKKLAEMAAAMQASFAVPTDWLYTNGLGGIPQSNLALEPPKPPQRRIEAPGPNDSILFYKDPVTGEDILCIRLPAVAHLHKSISYEVTQDILRRVGAAMKQWVEDNLQLILSKLNADSIAKELEKEMARRAADLNKNAG